MNIMIVFKHSNVIHPFLDQKVSLSQVDTPNLLVSTTSEVIRLQYDQDFHPKFSIRDLVSGADLPYSGNYTLTILGSGATVEQIKMWE